MRVLEFFVVPANGGAVAQLGARLDGIEEVEGSNPFGSTKILPVFLFTLRITPQEKCSSLEGVNAWASQVLAANATF
jgi:hypothetical protein